MFVCFGHTCQSSQRPYHHRFRKYYRLIHFRMCNSTITSQVTGNFLLVNTKDTEACSTWPEGPIHLTGSYVRNLNVPGSMCSAPQCRIVWVIVWVLRRNGLSWTSSSSQGHRIIACFLCCDWLHCFPRMASRSPVVFIQQVRMNTRRIIPYWIFPFICPGLSCRTHIFTGIVYSAPFLLTEVGNVQCRKPNYLIIHNCTNGL